MVGPLERRRRDADPDQQRRPGTSTATTRPRRSRTSMSWMRVGQPVEPGQGGDVEPLGPGRSPARRSSAEHAGRAREPGQSSRPSA